MMRGLDDSCLTRVNRTAHVIRQMSLTVLEGEEREIYDPKEVIGLFGQRQESALDQLLTAVHAHFAEVLI